MINMRATNTLIISVMLALLASCANIPKGVTAVSPFEKEKIFGQMVRNSPLRLSFRKRAEQYHCRVFAQ